MDRCSITASACVGIANGAAPALPIRIVRFVRIGGAVRRAVCLVIAAVWALSATTTLAGPYDSLLTGSHWYVPEENLLAFMTSGTSFTTPSPIVLWDQTLWSLGTSVDGRFDGNSSATFYVNPSLSFGSTSSILGIATDTGQIRMKFTSDGSSGGEPIIGIGQFRPYLGTTAMQMQMISGSVTTALTTHWAYMLPYDPATFTPPSPLPNVLVTSTEWTWTFGTTWNLHDDELFGPGGSGQFTVADYRNGYFWGSGQGPAGSEWETFTHLGSITPEGNVFFNMLSETASPTLVSLTGLIHGGPFDGTMALRSYGFSGDEPTFGIAGYATIVPEPSAAVAAAGAIATLLALRRWRRPAARRQTSRTRASIA